ncbi:hypothetical protein NHX12_012924 [Muraenolepis orangiensis]|uniref:Large ribosomal subunit protein mL49 n=1 Tax=Muraenolepis orangiensis TaxID=630683 RepID=A0A9Q0I4H1_9TELE|nr:hypothetical protein NHX12_012924 [Muraenolepis orangiensis]
MAARFTLQSNMIRGALRCASKLYSQQASGPASVVRLQPMCVAASEQTRHVIQESTEEYQFVERLIPPTRVPTPPAHGGPAPSGWAPPSDQPPALPYTVRRSRMHNIPVYTDISHGNRKTTLVRRVEGDIWALNRDVQQHLKEVTGKDRPTQVNEVTMSIRVKGHYDKEIKDYLLQKGF